MAFCPNCGKEIGENAAFCGSCGSQIKNSSNNIKFKKFENLDLKSILKTIKKYFLHFYVDYDSKFFKFAMSIFLAIGMGENVFYLVDKYVFSYALSDLFLQSGGILQFAFCVALFGIFSIFILKAKRKENIKKSSFLMIFWIVVLALNLLLFISSGELYKYVLFPTETSSIVKILGVISTVLLIYKNKPKSSIILIVSAVSFALSKSSLSSIVWVINTYKITQSNISLLRIYDDLKYIILVALLFLIVYLIPRRISKWLVLLSALSVVVLNVISDINRIRVFTFGGVCDFIIDISIILMFVLFALSCSREVKYEYIIDDNEEPKKRAIREGIISASSVLVIVFTFLLISAIVCSRQINAGIRKWENQIIRGNLTTSEQWDDLSKDMFKYPCTKFASQFVDDYYFYELIDENKYTMEQISICHSAYMQGRVDDDIIETYSYISVEDSWETNSTLSTYYRKYMEMQPDIEKVSVNAYVNVDNGEIEITVDNDNVMPISKCTVKCDFTILFVEPGMYSSNEYGRGSKTIVIENIDGSSAKTEIVSFNPDDYYDSYGSYMAAILMEKSASIISIG